MRRWCTRGRNRIHSEELRCLVEIAIIYQETLSVIALPAVRVVGAAEVGDGSVVVAGIVDGGVGEVAGWVYCAIQNVDYTVTSFLAGGNGRR